MTGDWYALAAAAVLRLPVSGHARAYAEKFRRPLRKAAYFAFREGFADSRRKWSSKQVERGVESELRIAVAAMPMDEGSLVGVTRDLGGTLRYDRRLLFKSAAPLAPHDVRLDARTLTLLESYLPVDACPLGAEVAAALLASESRLAPLGDAVGEAVRDGLAHRIAPERVSEVGAESSVQGQAPDRSAFLIGFGGYAREVLVPRLGAHVAGAADHRAALLRRHLTLPFPLYDGVELLLEQIAAADAPLVVVASYHSDHVTNALQALDANPCAHVVVEKPVAVSRADAARLAERRAAGAWIDVGYNRRYAPFTAVARRALAQADGPTTFTASVRENRISAAHWYFWPNQGTRITGNVCHWLDLAAHLVASPPTEVRSMGGADRVTVSVTFADGSLATVTASDDGDDLRGVQEMIEARRGGTTIRIFDYVRCEVEADGRARHYGLLRRDKGHARMYADVCRRWLGGEDPAYPLDDIVGVTRLVVDAVEGLQPARDPADSESMAPEQTR